MINKKKSLIFGFAVLVALNTVVVSNLFAQTVKSSLDSIKPVNVLDVVASPQAYMNSKVKVVAYFDRFSTLGLDYKPALRDSKNYISFLIRRPNVQNDHNIPLSELKLIISRDKAEKEKLVDLQEGDQIEFTGQVFSTALNDPWMDVEDVKILTSHTKNVADKVTSDKKADANIKQDKIDMMNVK